MPNPAESAERGDSQLVLPFVQYRSPLGSRESYFIFLEKVVLPLTVLEWDACEELVDLFNNFRLQGMSYKGTIDASLTWAATPQGHQYWSNQSSAYTAVMQIVERYHSAFPHSYSLFSPEAKGRIEGIRRNWTNWGGHSPYWMRRGNYVYSRNTGGLITSWGLQEGASPREVGVSAVTSYRTSAPDELEIYNESQEGLEEEGQEEEDEYGERDERGEEGYR